MTRFVTEQHGRVLVFHSTESQSDLPAGWYWRPAADLTVYTGPFPTETEAARAAGTEVDIDY